MKPLLDKIHSFLPKRKTSAPKYIISGGLSEKQIEADVANYLGWCTPGDHDAPFSLLDIDEQKTGADKLYDRGVAILIQFKRSTGLHPVSKVPASTRKNRSKLEAVREFRSEKGLDDDPSLFFKLHKKGDNGADYQHNILMSYEQPPNSRAIYVAPLVLEKAEYNAALYQSGAPRFLSDPFYYVPEIIHGGDNLRHYIQRTPFLREHVSIVPHENVDTHDHYYSYSENGCDISWHSPEKVGEGPYRLADFLGQIFYNATRNHDYTVPKAELLEGLLINSQRHGYAPRDVVNPDSPIQAIGDHGRWLLKTFRIRQFVLLIDSQQLRKFGGSF